VTACDILHIDRKTLTTEIERDGNFAQTMIALLGEKLYRQSIALENLLFLRATGRVARFILDRLKLDDAAFPASTIQLVLPVRKGLIASHLNMTQEHFSRTLHELSTAAIIRVEGVNVEVIDIERLRDAAGVLRAEKSAQAAH
jgi:CRP-like cAMP-binding protein